MSISGINGTGSSYYVSQNNQINGGQSNSSPVHKGHHHRSEQAQNTFDEILNSDTKQTTSSSSQSSDVANTMNSFDTVTGGTGFVGKTGTFLDMLV